MSSAPLSRIMEKCCAVNNEIWYVNSILNGLFKVDLLTGEVFYIGIVEEKEKYLRKAYSEIFYYENCLYMIPYNAAAIGIYNIITDKFEKIPFPEKTKEKFYEAILLEDKIYMLPYKTRNFYCFNIRTKRLSEISELKNINVSVFSSVEKEGKIWFTEDGGHSLYYYRPFNGEIKCIELGEAMGHFSTVGKVGKKIIVTAIDRALAISVDSKNENIECFDFEVYSSVKGTRNYYIAEYQDKAILICIGTNDCIMIDVQNGEITKNNFMSNTSSEYGKIWKYGQEIVMLPTVNNKAFHFYNGRTIPLNDKNALAEWTKKNDFKWSDYEPMPDYGIKKLIQILDTVSVRKVEKRKLNKNNIYDAIKG